MNDVHETRRQAAWWALLGQAPEAAGFLVTSLVNIRYLTGFSGSNAALLLQPSGALLCTDGRYVIQAGVQCPDLRLIVDRASASALCRVWGATAVGPLAIESDHVSVAALRGLQGMLAEVALEVSGVVEGCRAIKDDHEIAQIERACSISDLALHDILPVSMWAIVSVRLPGGWKQRCITGGQTRCHSPPSLPRDPTRRSPITNPRTDRSRGAISCSWTSGPLSPVTTPT